MSINGRTSQMRPDAAVEDLCVSSLLHPLAAGLATSRFMAIQNDPITTFNDVFLKMLSRSGFFEDPHASRAVRTLSVLPRPRPSRIAWAFCETNPDGRQGLHASSYPLLVLPRNTEKSSAFISVSSSAITFEPSGKVSDRLPFSSDELIARSSSVEVDETYSPCNLGNR